MHRQQARAPLLPANVPVLLYHHIEELPPGASVALKRWTITPEKFEAQMNWLADQGFNTISMDQLIKNSALPPKPIVLTFDDGWKDHHSAVLPLLKKHHFTATFFIITDSVGHSAYMNWDEVKDLSEAGMDIQSHTVTHPRLSTLRHDEAQQEIAESKKILEERLGKPVTILAYPFGSYDEDVIAVTKEAGYTAATTVSGLNGGYLYRADRTYTLDRYAIEGDDDLAGVARAKGFGK